MSRRIDAQHPAAKALARAQKRSRRMAFYLRVNQIFNFHPGDFWAFLQVAARWTLIGGVVGILAGTASAIFLISLEWATTTRILNPWLIAGLPLAGFVMGWTYRRFGGTAAMGNNLVIDEVNTIRSRIPLRMAPMILAGTVITHLFGGSAGREGTAIQMGASLADNVRRVLRLEGEERRLLLMAGIAGGFGSVFGVPAAGFIFGMEVQRVGRLRYDGLIPCLAASYIGDIVTRAWGAPHAYYPHMPHISIEPLLLAKVVLAGFLFGLTAILFIELTHGIKVTLAQITSYTPLYPVLGGVTLLLLTYLVGTTDYLGLSLPLIFSAVGEGGQVVFYAFALKLLFTSVTLGSGYLGGEVTPLFVIGATLGHTLGHLLGVDPAFMASIGLVAVFAGASNTPLACAVMGIELFGGDAALYLFIGCAVSYLASGHRGIYTTQRIDTPKGIALEVESDESLEALSRRRGGGWLPPLHGYGRTFSARPVHSLMTRRPFSASETTPFLELVTLALNHGIRTIPVVTDDGSLRGIISDRELQQLFKPHDAYLPITFGLLRALDSQSRDQIIGAVTKAHPNLIARDMMDESFTPVAENTTVAEAVQLLHTHDLRPLPVLDKDQRLAGILTRSDILRELAFVNIDYLRRDPLLRLDLTCGQLPLLSMPLVPHRDLTPAHAARVLFGLDTQEPGDRFAEPQGENSPPNPDAAERHRLIGVTDAENRLEGILTHTDLLTRLPQALRIQVLDKLLAGQVGSVPELLTEYQSSAGPLLSIDEMMSSPALYVDESAPALEAVVLSIRHGIKYIPVCDENHRPVGFVSRALLLVALEPRQHSFEPLASEATRQP